MMQEDKLEGGYSEAIKSLKWVNLFLNLEEGNTLYLMMKVIRNIGQIN